MLAHGGAHRTHVSVQYARVLATARSIEPKRARCGRGIHMKKWQCVICGFIYDEAEGLVDEGIAPGTRWEDIATDFSCPGCSSSKEDFEMMEIG